MSLPEHFEEQAIDERGLIEVGGQWVDPETGEVVDSRLHDDVTIAAKQAMLRYSSLDAQIANAKERKDWWAAREKMLRKRRLWFDKVFGVVIDFARMVRTGASAEVGAGLVKFTNSSNGSIEVKRTSALEWCRVHCPEAIVPKEDVSVSLLTEGARALLFADPEKAKENGFEVNPPGERTKIVTGAAI